MRFAEKPLRFFIFAGDSAISTFLFMVFARLWS